MKIILFIIIVVSFTKVQAQIPEIFGDSQSVVIYKDPRFDELSKKQAEINKRVVLSGPRRTKGYRVQAINTQNRDLANKVKAELLLRFPQEKSYLLYQSPNFRVRIGNFLTQREALQLRKLVAMLYPDRGIYVVPDVIEYTPLPDNDDDF